VGQARGVGGYVAATGWLCARVLRGKAGKEQGLGAFRARRRLGRPRRTGAVDNRAAESLT
jgi:hypothetical protein